MTRCAVEEGVPNACSALYGAAARWARKRGTPITTYTLQEESGASLRGAGWVTVEALPARTGAGWGSRPGRALTDRRPKVRWAPRWALELAHADLARAGVL